jgi:hypothetical protein
MITVVNNQRVKYWYNKEHAIHRDNDKPAIKWSNGDKQWYQNGKLHRDNDKAASIRSNGTKAWYHNGKLHRVGNDKPTIIYANGDLEWYKEGKLHRDIGFAIVRYNNNYEVRYVARYVDGKKISYLSYDQCIVSQVDKAIDQQVDELISQQVHEQNHSVSSILCEEKYYEKLKDEGYCYINNVEDMKPSEEELAILNENTDENTDDNTDDKLNEDDIHFSDISDLRCTEYVLNYNKVVLQLKQRFEENDDEPKLEEMVASTHQYYQELAKKQRVMFIEQNMMFTERVDNIDDITAL